MRPDSLLALSGVSRTYGKERVLSDISFDAHRGECIAIVGPSGCGKSTLLRLIAGLDDPTSGEITRNVEHIQMVFQEATLLPWRTLRENVELPGELSRNTSTPQQISEVLTAVNLIDHEDKFPHELSGGMKMRGALARALITQSDLYLLDEPFSAVDEITRESLQNLFTSLQRQSQFTALFVTHNVTEAVFLADRVIVMSAITPSGSQSLHIVDVPFGPDREEGLRFTLDFSNVCKQVHEHLQVATS